MNWIVAKRKTKDITKQILINRGIKEFDKFINPDFSRDMLDASKINDIDKAAKIIFWAKENNKKIGIFADYDADGVPGAALLAKLFEKLEIKYGIYIPTRNEGYGLSKKGIEKLRKEGAEILITVDLGITGRKEVEFAKKLGMKIIITDHHEIIDELIPNNADALVHTHLSKEYKNKDLAGGAVVYKIIQYLAKKYHSLNESDTKWLLDLPAICTICDMVPLIGENRVIAKFGLVVLSKTKNIGLKKIYAVAQIDEKNITTYHVGFLIGPRINAPGRITDASNSFLLLTTKDKHEAVNIANKLNNINIQRQKTLDELIEKATCIINKEDLEKNKIILIKGNNWPLGIIGLVSSRITEKYNRPSIVFTQADGVLRGSARSIDDFEIINLLEKTKDILISYGGHAKAAGVVLEEKNWQRFFEKACQIAKKEIADCALKRKIKIDVVLDDSNINMSLVNQINKLEPYGFGNPRPIFELDNLEVVQIKKIGKKLNHLKLKLKSDKNKKIFDAIYFNCIEKINLLSEGIKINIVFYLEKNIWNGKISIQFNLLDFKIN